MLTVNENTIAERFGTDLGNNASEEVPWSLRKDHVFEVGEELSAVLDLPVIVSLIDRNDEFCVSSIQHLPDYFGVTPHASSLLIL